MDTNFKQYQYIFNKGMRKGAQCKSKTLNKYCKKHSKTKVAEKESIEMKDKPIEEQVEQKIQEVND